MTPIFCRVPGVFARIPGSSFYYRSHPSGLRIDRESCIVPQASIEVNDIRRPWKPAPNELSRVQAWTKHASPRTTKLYDNRDAKPERAQCLIRIIENLRHGFRPVEGDLAHKSHSNPIFTPDSNLSHLHSCLTSLPHPLLLKEVYVLRVDFSIRVQIRLHNLELIRANIDRSWTLGSSTKNVHSAWIACEIFRG